MTVSERAWRRMYRTEAWGETKQCVYCHEPMQLRKATADHTVPRSKGGKTTKANIKAVCAACNVAKGSLSEIEFVHKIKSPFGESIGILMAWSRRKIWLATHRVCKRILQ